jgi:hypothetical protein
MLEHLAYLVFHENRSACWRDFQKFIVDGKQYYLKQGTIRNNLSRLRRLGLIELAYRSSDAYYTLPGENHSKISTVMTPNHARVCKRDLADFIERMAFDKPAAHDIHLRFNVQMIWDTLSVLASSSLPSSVIMSTSTPTAAIPAALYIPSTTCTSSSVSLSTRPVSKDLVLPVMMLDSGIKGKVTIHKNDTVSVILSCSGSPIKFDVGGLIRLSSSLARIEDRLLILIDVAQYQRLLQSSSISSCSSSAANPAATSAALTSPVAENRCDNNNNNNKKMLLHVPEHGSWIVTMWHIGRDSIERYAGEKFEIAWEDFMGEWIRVYSKEIDIKPSTNKEKRNKKASKKQRIVRIERQEYPIERLRKVVENKLSSVVIASTSSADYT